MNLIPAKNSIRQKRRGIFLFFLALAISPIAYSDGGYEEYFKDRIVEIKKSCKDHGNVMAEVRFNKWIKNGDDPRKKLGGEAFGLVSLAMQQQCVSVYTVIILRMLKSEVSSEQANKMRIDEQIEKHLDVIEKTL